MGRKKRQNDLTYDTLPALFTGICDAIRSKAGTVGLINHQDIPAAISNIPTGSGTEVLDIFNGSISVPAAGAFKSYTMEKAGYITMVAVINGVGRNVRIRKNSTNVETRTGTDNTFMYGIAAYHIAVAVGDVISLYKEDSGSGSCTLVLILEED